MHFQGLFSQCCIIVRTGYNRGQWSIDVMRNGDDYYIIDMALAENSALNDCVPRDKLRAYPQQWLPGESNN